jgi:2-polyprenyl-3-methyl-5-hydroxy-6-metoxy-1,4-benzoquinol methylase
MKCISCSSEEYQVVYDGPIRSGSYGKLTSKNFKVIECKKCSLTRLEEFPEIHYENEEYRLDYNDTSDIRDYFKNHDLEQTPRINKIGIEQFRDKVVLDFGCGGGSFLDSIKGIAKKTIAVEPFVGYHESLKFRGHEVYSDIKDCSHLNSTIDIVISFGVIEHINEPLLYLKNAFDILNINGKMFIETDNLDDVLVKLGFKEFEPFYYRTVHSYYFNTKSLKELAQKAGFNEILVGHRHGFGISNTIKWLNNRKPGGLSKLEFITPEIDFAWVQMLEKTGMAELLHFELVKTK